MEETVRNSTLGVSRAAFFTSRALSRHRFSLSVAAAPGEDEDSLSFEELLSQTWSMYGVSALFGFQYNDELQFKLYGKRLREEIANTLQQENVAYEAKFSIAMGMSPRPSPMDPPAIKVEVFAKSIIEEESTTRCIYKGILISWRAIHTDLSTGYFVRLPLLLCRGTRSCMQAVHTTICRMFDCMIMALPANEYDMMWLVPIAILPKSKDEHKITDVIKLEYAVAGLPRSKFIVNKYHTCDLAKMLEVINNSQHDDVGAEIVLDVEHIDKFHEILHYHMFRITGFQLGTCTLHKIQCRPMTIKDNKIKVTDHEIMNRVLLYFTEKASDTFHAVQFSI